MEITTSISEFFDAIALGGNVTMIANNTIGQTENFTYDDLNRLKQAWTTGNTLYGYSQSHDYDKIGNLITKTGTSIQYGANLNATGNGPHQARRVNGVSYTYDANGNLENGGGRSYTWDGLNRPTSITGVGGVTESYLYDPDGARVARIRNGTTTVYFAGLIEQVFGGVTTTRYHFNGTNIAQRAGAALTYLHGDHLGSMSVATDSNGILVSRQFFDPWGQVRGEGISQTTLNYTGQHRDDTGLLFYNARYYDPAIGRFISADTIVPSSGPLTVTPSDAVAQGMWGKSGGGAANPQELNRYSYVNNNPVKYTDPTGHCIGVLAGADTVMCAIGGAAVVVTAPAWLVPVAIGAGVIAAGAGIAYLASEAVNNEEAASDDDRLSVEDYLTGAKSVKTDRSKVYTKPGDESDASIDFNALTKGVKVEHKEGGVLVATLPDGTRIILRPHSSAGNSASSVPAQVGGFPTIEIQAPRSKPSKVRYVAR